jgi:hypothetical protein
LIEFSLLGAALTAFAAAYLALRLTRPAVPDRPLDRLIGAALAGMAAGRIAAMIQDGINPLTDPGQLLFVRGGVDTMWASLTAVTALTWPLRGNLSAIDRLSPLALAGLAGWQAGCLWRGACLGMATDLPWGWPLASSTTDRHPVELYAALILVIGTIVVARIGRPAGMASALAVVWAAGARLVTEPLRPHLGSGRMWFYLLGLAVGSLGAALAAIKTRSVTSTV